MKFIVFPIVIFILSVFFFFRKRGLHNDVEKKEGMLPDKKKPKLWIYIAFVTFLLLLTIIEATMGLKNGVSLQVQAAVNVNLTHHSFKLPNHNYFTSEESGKLYWYPKNFLQALLLNVAVKHAALDIFEIILLYATVAIFYFMTLGSGKKSVFSVNLLGGYMLIFFLIAMSGILKSFEYSWMSIYIKKITNGQFVLQPLNVSFMLYIMWGNMLFFMLRFAQQALDMQKEQELTI